MGEVSQLDMEGVCVCVLAVTACLVEDRSFDFSTASIVLAMQPACLFK